MSTDPVILYLFHWDEPLVGGQHPQHYLGSTPEARLSARIHEHLGGGNKQAKIVRAALEAGRDVRLVALWRGTRADESHLKKSKRGFRHICPDCKTKAA